MVADSEGSETLEEINAFMETWLTAWRAMDVKLMMAMFDPNFEGPIYLAEENSSFLQDFDSIRAYWQFSTDHVTTEMRRFNFIGQPQITLLSHNIAIVGVLVDTHLLLRALPEGVMGTLRGSLVLRKAGGENTWSIAHYHESRQLLLTDRPNDSYRFFVDAYVPS